MMRQDVYRTLTGEIHETDISHAPVLQLGQLQFRSVKLGLCTLGVVDSILGRSGPTTHYTYPIALSACHALRLSVASKSKRWALKGWEAVPRVLRGS